MDWFTKAWIIEDEQGEKEFLACLFGTQDIICEDEDVSTFSVIHIAGDYYSIELVSIAQDNYKTFFTFPSQLYKPQRIEETGGKIITHDEAELLFTDSYVFNGSDKHSADSHYSTSTHVTGQDLLFFHPVTGTAYLDSSGMYTCIQTISNRFYVKVGCHPRHQELDTFEGAGVKVAKKRCSRYTVKKTYTPPDQSGRSRLDIELSCKGKVAHITAYANG